MTLYEVRQDTSTVIVEARSSMGPITFEATGLAGEVEAAFSDGRFLGGGAAARVRLPVSNLVSGNELFDAELQRRLSARIHPEVVLELRSADPHPDGTTVDLAGTMTMHGVVVPMHGAVSVVDAGEDRIVVQGEHHVDIRDFGIPAPTVLMLKIYPDVRVLLLVEAVRSDGPPGG